MKKLIKMVVTIKQNSTKAVIDELLKQLFSSKKTKGFDARKFCGAVKFKGDALSIQKRMRNEWK